MKMTRKISLLMVLMLAGYCGMAQNLSNRGKEFWVGYGHHQYMEQGQPNSQEMVIYLSAEQAANVTVTIDSTTWVRNYSIPANTVIATEYLPKSGATDARLITLPCGFVPPGTACGGEGAFSKKGIHIVSDVPIVAYAHIFGNASSGATMLMPVETWGYVYTTLNSTQEYASNCFSWVYAIAQHDSTIVEITPAAATRTGKVANVPFSVMLMKGQIYQVMAGPEAANPKPEMSGTKVRSIANPNGKCYPIAVFAGSSRTHNTMTCGASSGGDNDNQQCFPSQAWGKRYLTAPTSNSVSASVFQTNSYKIAVKDPATVVRKNGVTLTGLINNSYYKYESATSDYIESDKPVMVAQFMAGGNCLNGGVGDPEMMYISPIEQGIKRIGFYRNDEENITVNYLTLIIPTAGVPSLKIDGSAVFNHTYVHPNLPGYTVVIKRWSAAKAQSIAQSDSAFTAITYGLGSVESYGYNAGTNINNLNLVSAIHNPADTNSTIIKHDYTCKNTPVELAAYVAYKPTKMVWQISQLGSVVTPNADIIDNAPTVLDSTTINGTKYYRYKCPGTYLFSDTGTFSIPVLSTHPSIENCINTEQLNFSVTVRGTPRPDYTLVGFSGCTADTITFSGLNPTLNGYNVQMYRWTFPGNILDSGQVVKKLLPVGNNLVKLSVVTNVGCVGDTTRTVAVADKPLAGFGAAPPSFCQGGSATFTDTSSFAGGGTISSYYWDFGNGNTLSLGANTPQVVPYPNYGTFTIKHVVKISNTCYSDTVYRTVVVYAKPTPSFNYPAGCLPANGVIQFTSTSTVPDGQALNTYAWNFGDPNANAGNPNTAVIANPTHFYSTYGTYTILYSAGTVNGCIKDTTLQATFNIRPTLAYTALPAICQNVTGTVSVANGSVTNAVPGTGVYHGPATDPAGNFSPSAAGPGTHTIWYVFASTGGCTDSVSQTILVHAKPVVSFTYPSAGCLPVSGIVQFTNGTTVSDGQALSYLWHFGDPNANAGNPNTSTGISPTHNYLEGSFTIKLVVLSANGCTDSLSVNASFSVKPVLAYPALASQCQDVSTPVSIATATVTNGVTGTGIYKGPGTNAAGNFTPSAAGFGTHTIWYVFTTTGGCKDSISQTISVRAKPMVAFAFPAAGCLPITGFVQFADGTTIADGQALTYLWNFNDPAATVPNPNTSTAQNPSHNFLEGTFNVKLVVTTSNGCIGDTTITRTLSVKPSLNYPALASQCQNISTPVSVATATVINGVTGTGIYKGPGTNAAGSFTPSIAGFGTHTIWYVFTTAGGCKDSVSQTIAVRAKPMVAFAFPGAGCLPTNGTVQFTDGTTIADGQALTYLWNFNDPAATVPNPNTSTAQNPSHNFLEGTFAVKLVVTTSTGCIGDTTITRTLSVKPALAYPALTSQCQNISTAVSIATATVTNGVTGTGIYKGPGTDAAGNFTPSAAGFGTHTIWYVFTTTGGCKDSISQTIAVRAKPMVSFAFPGAGCLPTNGTVQFTDGTTIADGQSLTYLWNFNDPSATVPNPNTSTAQNPSHNFLEGTFAVKLVVTTSTGCIGDTTITRTLSVKPALAYPALTSQCQNISTAVSIATATVTNGITGTGIYKGPGTDAAGNFTPSIAGFGTHTIWYVFTTAGGCKDSVSQTIAVRAKPVVRFSFPATSCLPTNGTVQFTDATTIADGQALTYLWNFNDPNATVPNPNTSTSQNPSHNFLEGTFNVKLVVTTVTGCIGDTTITANISVRPLLSYPALAGKCESVAGAVSIAGATVTNGISGTGIYKGPGTDAAGNFSPSIAGAGTHTIWYVFTTTGGCKDSISNTIKVSPKPTALFNLTNSVCLGQTTTINQNSTISSGNIVSWKWDFGDATSATYNNGNIFTKLYSAFGAYTVKLVAVSDSGCVSDTASRIINVRAIPVAGFTMPASVCMPNGTVAFTNTSVAPDNAALTYQWNFGDASPASNATSPGHVYASSGSYNIRLRATSSFGCSKDSIRTFSAFFDKPIAKFGVTPDTLCQGVDNIFTDQSTAPNSTVKGRLWIFGDGTTSAGTAPVKKYALPGIYDVKLVVTNNENCVSDTFTKRIVVYLQPVIDAGPSFVVPFGTVLQFQPQANDSTVVSFLWTPATGLLNSAVLRPVLQATVNQTYTLTATGQGSCTATDFLTVKILKKIKVPNAFSPNGDGTNDTWIINDLNDYAGATVEVFNRYGQSVYFSNGYSTPWDGTYKGKPLPLATYYYIINLKNGFQPVNGSVTIVK